MFLEQIKARSQLSISLGLQKQSQFFGCTRQLESSKHALSTGCQDAVNHLRTNRAIRCFTA